MKTPPLLLGAALLFWGWQSELFLVGALMAVVVEGARFVRIRWEFSDDDLSRIWTFCTVLFLAAIVYAFTANEGVSNFAGFFQDPTLGSQRQAGESSARTAASMIRWLPMVLFLFAAAQMYNTRDQVPLAAISLLMRRRLRKARERGEPAPTLRTLNVTYPYFSVCLFAACAHTARGETFYPGFAALLVWALWPHRPRRYGYLAWSGALVSAVLLGYAGQEGITRLQGLVNNYNPQWFSRFTDGRFDPEINQTSLGQIGKLKTSGRIAIRLKTRDGRPPPPLLREACYTDYRSPSWLSQYQEKDFQGIPSDPSQTGYTLLREVKKVTPVQIACSLPRGKALLPLPTGSMRLEKLFVFTLNQNKLGAVLATGPRLVIFDALYGPGATTDAPVDTNQDLKVPQREMPALAEVAARLNVDGQNREAKLRAVSRFFSDNFSYSLWQPPPPVGGTNEMPLSRFLLETHSGHCEYFATATVLLLRKLGIPARYVVGYSVHEGAGDNYVVRQRDAHAWCLVWNEAQSVWEDFDTTPASWIDVEGRRASMFQWLSDAWSRVRFEIARIRYGQSNLRQYLVWLLVPVLIYLLYQIIFRRRKSRHAKGVDGGKSGMGWPGLDSEFYEIEQALSKLGFERESGEAVTSWLARLMKNDPFAGSRDLILGIRTLHYRYRFDPRGLSPDEREQLRRQAQICLRVFEELRSTHSVAR